MMITILTWWYIYILFVHFFPLLFWVFSFLILCHDNFFYLYLCERTCFIALFISAHSAPYLFQLIRWLPPLSLFACVCVVVFAVVVVVYTLLTSHRLCYCQAKEKLWSNNRFFLYARALLVGGLISSLDQPVLSICFRCCAWQLHATCMSYQCWFLPFFLCHNLHLASTTESFCLVSLRSFCVFFVLSIYANVDCKWNQQ